MSHTQFKIIIFIFMALIVYNLFRGLYFLVSGKEGGKGTARSLSWRIGLSIALFVLLLALKFSGIVKPHALGEKLPAAEEKTLPEQDEGKTLEEIRQQDNDGRIRLKP
jgi:hypothetical protein